MKIKELQKELVGKGIDCALLMNSIADDNNLFYFTSLEMESGVLLVPKKGAPTYFVPQMEEERAKKQSLVRNIKVLKGRKAFESMLRKQIQGKVLGINGGFAPINLVKWLRKTAKPNKVKDISKILIALRAQKTASEIKTMQEACDISKQVFNATIKNFRRLKSEKAVITFMESQMALRGVKPSFPIIVASGKNASMPHAEPSERLNKGFCIIDFGVKYKGYCSDITRTIYIGKPVEKEKEEYYRLLGVQEEAIFAVKPGADFFKLQESVVKVLGKRFIHGLGHGLGIDVHEFLGGKRPILNAGNILTIEPGIYEPGKFGIRIEDDILVTKKGAVVLSKAIKKDLIVI